MNANIIETKNCHERKDDLKVHQRSHKVTFMFKDQNFFLLYENLLTLLRYQFKKKVRSTFMLCRGCGIFSDFLNFLQS